MKRLFVDPCDNGDTLEGPPRQRTWLVVDRETGRCVADLDDRKAARAEAALLNRADPSVLSPMDAAIVDDVLAHSPGL